MLIERELPPFAEWIVPALQQFGIGVLSLLFLVLLLTGGYATLRAILSLSLEPYRALGRSIARYLESIYFIPPIGGWRASRSEDTSQPIWRVIRIAFFICYFVCFVTVFLSFGWHVLVLGLMGYALPKIMEIGSLLSKDDDTATRRPKVWRRCAMIALCWLVLGVVISAGLGYTFEGLCHWDSGYHTPMVNADNLPFVEDRDAPVQLTAETAILIACGNGAGLFLLGMLFGFGDRALVQAVRRGRIAGIAYLAMKEAIRKKIIIGFVIFLLVLMIGGWYLDPGSSQPAYLYLSVVMSLSGYLVLLLMLFLSTFSIPSDIKSKSVYTVVTKPVYASEIVIGRFLGLATLGTGFLIVMCLLSYLFVSLGLSHQHVLTQEDLSVASDTETGEEYFTGDTRRFHGHSHVVSVMDDGTVFVEEANHHTHDVVVEEGDDGITRYRVLPTQGAIEARVPDYGETLVFRDRTGIDRTKGINVGDEWQYRSFISGGTQAAAIWTFEDFDKNAFPVEQFPDGIPIDLTVEAFRTYKGNIEETVTGNLLARNPKTGLTVPIETFHSNEGAIKTVFMPFTFDAQAGATIQQRKAITQTGQQVETPAVKNEALIDELAEPVETEDGVVYELDLFEDIVDDEGRLEIWLECLKDQHYFGAAKADLYVHRKDASVLLNFFKGYFGIWQAMILVIVFGVMFSTFLSGAVALVASVGSVFVGGMFHEFLVQMAHRQLLGGGPFEALWRLVSQKNLLSALPPTLAAGAATLCDKIISFPLMGVALALPPLSDLDYSHAVASGFDVSWGWILAHGVMTLGYAIPVLLAGCLFLQNREVAK